MAIIVDLKIEVMSIITAFLLSLIARLWIFSHIMHSCLDPRLTSCWYRGRRSFDNESLGICYKR